LFLAAALMAATAGCVAVVEDRHSSHPHGGPPGQTKKVVVVDAGHFCVDSCDHFYLDGVWYIEVGHRHGPGCGHYLVKGKWGKHKGDDKADDKKDKKEKKDKKDKD
jgi:hypothetical protein